MDPTPLRRRDTLKGPPLRILSLDGGGVRGYSMLILLQELMYRTYVEVEGKAPQRHQIPKPCDHFDLIAGTGTGGLIAIMLGRLRMDIETCKDVYVRMTKRVFETDKTFAGIPYRSTLFKASKLEEAIKECVQEYTALENDGSDTADINLHQAITSPSTPTSARTATTATTGPALPRRTLSKTSTTNSVKSKYDFVRPYPGMWGDPNAPLYDIRENRTKTAVTAVFKGTPKNGSSVLLRSYDSRKEPPPEFKCSIWEAGRATCATGLAFKPIQIGLSVFLDEGAGKYNPAPQVLDEATVNEWPDRDVGAFVSVGTGKRPPGTGAQQHLWWEDFVTSGMGDFAEARRRLIAKIEGCEKTHQYMMDEYLSKRGVSPDNYFRLNVEVGVGEFGMNEWNRLADISTSTRHYLAKSETQRLNVDAATRLAKIHRARARLGMARTARQDDSVVSDGPIAHSLKPSNVLAAELPGSEPPPAPASPRQQLGPQYPPTGTFEPNPSSQDKFTVITSEEPSRIVNQNLSTLQPRRSIEVSPISNDVNHNRTNADPSRISPPRSAASSYISSPRRSGEQGRHTPPPLPPKAPIQERHDRSRLPNGRPAGPLPYPEDDGPPPVVNMARKPELGR